MKLHENRVPKSFCPYCKQMVTAAAGIDEVPPSPGMLSICIFCASLSQFDDNMQLVRVSSELWEEIKAEDPEFVSQLEMHQTAITIINQGKYSSRIN